MRHALLRWLLAGSIGAVLVGVTWSLLTSMGKAPDAAADQKKSGDFICGPRCVEHILNHYGKEEDLIALVKEIQWPDLESGATLDALERALQKRGVHTRALRIGSNAKICWPHPVLLHLEGTPGLGHFVVWHPTAAPDTETVWVGLNGLQSGPAEALARLRSGVVLLTSPSAITNPELAVTLHPDRTSWPLYLGGACLTLLSLGILRYLSRGRPVQPRLPTLSPK